MSMVRSTVLAFAAISLLGATTKPGLPRPMYYSGTTGSLFMEICKSQVWQPGNYDPCGSYLLGLIDAYANADILCPPNGVGNRQMEQIAFNYVRDHPERWQYPMSVTIRVALADYACKRR